MSIAAKLKHAFFCIPVLLVATFALGVGLAQAETESPGLAVDAETWPTNLPPGGQGLIYLTVLNTGAGNTTGQVTVTDVLPPGVTAIEAGTQGEYAGSSPLHEPAEWECTGAHIVKCVNNPTNLPSLTGGGGTPGGGGRPEGARYGGHDPRIELVVSVESGVSGAAPNVVTAAGGGAPEPASSTTPVTISATPAPFGVADFDAWFSNADGTTDTQAGSHPYAATFLFNFNLKGEVRDEGGVVSTEIHASEQVRDLEVELPAGLVGDVHDVPQCPRELFENDQYRFCPADTQIGIVTPIFGQSSDPTEPVFNIQPPPGKPAEFGFTIVGNPTYLDSSVRTESDDGINTDSFNVVQRNIQSTVVTLWSNPGDPSHAPWSGAYHGCGSNECEGLMKTKPLLTLPTACVGPQHLTVRMHPWYHEDVTSEQTISTHTASGVPVGFSGCEKLAFSPTITTATDTARSDSPAGLTVDVRPPVGGLTSNEGLSAADIQNTTVTLPEGLVVNPGQAAGLLSCPASSSAIGSPAPVMCPEASKVGVVSITTPLLDEPLAGDVYLLQSNPPELKLLVAGSAEGVNLKLVGTVHLDKSTGRLTTTFEGTPELPFTDFKLAFSGGPQAALDTPSQCGIYTTSSDFTPWSSPFVEDIFTDASFSLSEGPGGTLCPSSPMPFGPTLTAGSTTDQAGGFTGFSMLLQRGDGQQRIEKLQFKAPAGLSGMISRVPLCDEADANAGMCPALSHVGHVTVTSGPGPYPLVIPQPGEPEAPIYLTGPYQGAPFGLSIVTPVIAGPFNLGTIVTRAKVEVDPHTAAITVTTNPLPQIIDGVPTDLRAVDAVIDREGFMFNPTNCSPQSFSGTASSAQAAVAPISSHFQVGSCQSLKFQPDFKVSTSGKTSKANGASLTTKIFYPTMPVGSSQASSQANIASVKVDLPKQLPSRLTTLQKACTSLQFEANPAGCPAASVIGHARVVTPLLPVPVEGPAYFVSHGGEAFPSLTIVLQGDNVTIDLVGTTYISKVGITSSTFKTVPDVPFSTFELTLPQGRYSALAANGSLCASKLVMPTAFVGQNGLVIHESTPISVTGCAKAKALTRAQKLAAALKVCKRDGKGKKRAGCEKTARKSYGSLQKKK